MSSSHGIGVKRNDYHRRNRRRNISTHSTSAGINTESSFLRILNTSISVPAFDRDVLIDLALQHFAKKRDVDVSELRTHSKAKLCVTYLRHYHSPYESLLGSRKWKNHNHELYLTVFKRVMDAIAESNPWLRDECQNQFEEKSSAASFTVGQHHRVRVIKGGGLLTSEQIEEMNARENAAFHLRDEPESLDESLEIPLFFEALSSLDQIRFLYLPPFLKREELVQRRFGENPSDRWWEWEEELGLQSLEGRPDAGNAQQ
jgi:hypothetical protein